MARGAVVSIRDMWFWYGEILVLENVSLDIEQGEFAAIIGPNGSGKTTLIKLMMGMLEPERGTIGMFGTTPPAARGRFGYMPQHPQLDFAFPVTVMDVVLMGRLGHGLNLGPYRGADRERAEKAIKEVNCEGLRDRPFGALSSGQRQRILIARALTSDPELLFLDEPTANLDPSIQGDFYELLHGLNERMTLVIVSHDVGFVSKHVNKVICVNRDVVLHRASEIHGDLVSMLYGKMGVRLVDHDRHSHEP